MKKIFVFTRSFPFEKGEEFFQEELVHLCQAFDQVFLVPTGVKDFTSARQIPQNARLILLELGKNRAKRIDVLLKNLFWILGDIAKEFVNTKLNLKSLDFVARQSLFAHFLATRMKEKLSSDDESIFYSYWMNYNAVAIAHLKREKWFNGRFVFRTHGGDLYNDRQLFGFIPFRKLCYLQADRVITISHHGFNYLQTNFPVVKAKLVNSYLGVLDHGIGLIPESDRTIKLVSCSSIIPLKRVDKIIDVLTHLTSPVEWVHFGDGFEGERVRQRATEVLPSHVKATFKGFVSNEQLIDYYRKNGVDIFVNLSSSEGLPVSLMEAASFGIPLIGNDVGGVGEIVNTITGHLFAPGEEPKKIAEKIEELYISNKTRSKEFRLKVREYWRHNFWCDRNYASFIKHVLTEN